MRLSLRRAAHVVLASSAKWEIRVRYRCRTLNFGFAL
jgi:hypothetical protein